MQRNTNTLGMLCAVCTISLLSPVTKMAFAQENPAAIVKFVDTAGNVVDGVDAFHCYQAKSTRLVISDGQAKLPAAGGIVVATKDGFEYCGTILNDSERNSVTMLRPGEQPRTYTTLPNPVSKKLKDDLIKQISDDYWKRITDNPKDIRTTMQAMKVLTRVSPEKVEEFLNNNDVPVPVKQSTTNLLLRSYAKSDFPAAIEMADSFTEPMFRSMAFNLLLTVSDPTQAELAAVEKQLIDTAKSIKQPAYRLVTWAVLARHYERTGRREQAKRIIDQHLEEAKKLPSDGWAAYPKSLFAALVVAENPELGKEMIDGVDGNEKTRATGRLAFHCCRTRPKLAVELLDTIEAPENSVMAFVHHIKVCGRIGVKHTDAALNLAASITEPNQQSWAYRLIAEALADVKPEKAKQVLELAAHSLDSDRNSAMGLHISTTMGGLLPVYEKLAPEKMRSLIWQTVYLAQPKSRWNDNGPTPLTHIQNAAATISRYDRQLANALDIGEQEVPRNFDPTRSATNFITLKPEQLTEFLKDLEEQRTSNALRPRETVIEMLMGTDAEFWAAVSKPSFLQYLSDRFEEH